MAQALYSLNQADLVKAFARSGYEIEDPAKELKDPEWVSYNKDTKTGIYKFLFWDEISPMPDHQPKWSRGYAFVSYDQEANILADY